MYCDAEKIKQQYRTHQRTMEEYKRTQHPNSCNSLTDSQFTRFEGEFMILNKSAILDPYK